MIKERQIEHLFSLHRFRFVQAHLSKGAKRRTKAAQRRQFLDVLMVACGLRNACLPDHGVTLDTEAWQEVLESLRREGHALVTGLDVIELEGTPLIVHRERLCSAFEAEAWRKLFSFACCTDPFVCYRHETSFRRRPSSMSAHAWQLPRYTDRGPKPRYLIGSLWSGMRERSTRSHGSAAGGRGRF